MADGIVIWSRTPVHQRKTFFDSVEAAYESRLQFYLHGYSQYQYKGKIDCAGAVARAHCGGGIIAPASVLIPNFG